LEDGGEDTEDGIDVILYLILLSLFLLLIDDDKIGASFSSSVNLGDVYIS
jgi:hypothetical protein